MQNHLKVTINSKQYSIATDEDSQYIFEAAQLVDTLLKNTAGKSSPSGDEKAALIVALQLATDLAKSKRGLQAYEEKVEGLITLLAEEV